MTPAMLILGWERFTMLRFTQTDDAARVLRDSRHLLTPDGMRFAPVRLMRELGLGKPFAQAEADAQAFAGLRAQLEASGWRILRHGDDGFDRAATAWAADCQSVSPGDAPVPGKDMMFVVPA